jgi:diguanylate cyclase (GGDEF)-like protein
MIVATLCLAWRRRGRTVLDAWLLVAACAALFEAGLVRLGDSRFCVAWYVAHFISLTGALAVLGACLFEINRLYGGLVRNRERMSGVNAGLRAANNELAAIAVRDELTGLLNRRAIIARLAQALDDHRSQGLSFSVLMVDLDHFKAVNDQLGHLGGDQVLAQVAVRLKDAIRSSDAVGRYGGEEFLVFLQDTTAAQARTVASKLLRAIRAEPFVFQGHAVPVTVSIGVATVQAADRTLEELVGRADKALYTAKREGRDRQVASERPNEHA